MNILLLEDDETLAYAIQRFLLEEGHQVSHFPLVDLALECRDIFDLYLVDIFLPEMSGYDFVKKLRQYNSAPVIYLTAKDDENSILKAFETGADDYITKPFSLKELKSRMQAISRRTDIPIFSYHELVLDIENALVTFKEEQIHLSVQEYRIILLLLKNPEQLITRSMLNGALGIFDSNLQDNTLNVAMRRLRQKLPETILIKTIHNQGYVLTV